MRRLTIAATLFLCLLSISAHARSGPDCVNVMGISGFECVARAQAPAKRHAKVQKPKPRKATRVAGKTFKPSPVVSFHSSAAPWLAVARADVGKSARQLGVPSRLWCADAANKWLRDAGYNGTGSRRAKDFLKYGVRTSARPGAIAVYHRGKNGGHVALVESVNGNKVTLISGNCSRKGVCRYTRSVGSAIAYVWPEA